MSNEKRGSVVRQLAQRIADDLFTNGNGDVAIRLMLEREDGRYLGGWSKKPLVDRIVHILTAENLGAD